MGKWHQIRRQETYKRKNSTILELGTGGVLESEYTLQNEEDVRQQRIQALLRHGRKGKMSQVTRSEGGERG